MTETMGPTEQDKVTLENAREYLGSGQLSNSGILDGLIAEITDKKSVSFIQANKGNKRAIYDYLYHNIPAVKYVLERYVNFMFADGLTTGDEDESKDERLKDWLYKTNKKDVTNYNAFMQAVGWSLIFGKVGLRWLSEEDGWITVLDKNYASVEVPNKEYYGFKEVVAYAITIDPNEEIQSIDLEGDLKLDVNKLVTKGFIVDEQRGVIFVPPTDFVNLRHETMFEDGESVFEFDVLRLLLVTEVLEKMIDDVRYDGPGRIILPVNEKRVKGEDNTISAGEIVNKSHINGTTKRDEIITEIKGVQKNFKDSTDKSVIALSEYFGEIKHLPKVVKATDFLSYMQEQADTVAAQVLGINPAVLGIGRLRGNISMEKIIDNEMLNSIIPKREKFAIQISQLLADKLELPKVFFNKYEMQQIEDNTREQMNLARVIETLERHGYVDASQRITQLILENLQLEQEDDDLPLKEEDVQEEDVQRKNKEEENLSNGYVRKYFKRRKKFRTRNRG